MGRQASPALPAGGKPGCWGGGQGGQRRIRGCFSRGVSGTAHPWRARGLTPSHCPHHCPSSLCRTGSCQLSNSPRHYHPISQRRPPRLREAGHTLSTGLAAYSPDHAECPQVPQPVGQSVGSPLGRPGPRRLSLHFLAPGLSLHVAYESRGDEHLGAHVRSSEHSGPYAGSLMFLSFLCLKNRCPPALGQ